ncbi:predicted protein [Botrytis cinerea T4]|uniref:Uncharacterized protein n=1 Tax=Botryotinia fuckeliana (strain T4) TaxID=999810 RepID=G2YLJ5_BOTF4|nr:predicted protein [Botrytis cinerea T4]
MSPVQNSQVLQNPNFYFKRGTMKLERKEDLPEWIETAEGSGRGTP